MCGRVLLGTGRRGGRTGGQAARPTPGLRQEGPELCRCRQSKRLWLLRVRGTSPRETGGPGQALGPSGGNVVGGGQPPAPRPGGAMGGPHAGVFNA